MDSQIGSVWQRVARLKKTLMSSSSISTSGMSRTWSELAVSASKLNIAKNSEAVMKPAAPSIVIFLSKNGAIGNYLGT